MPREETAGSDRNAPPLVRSIASLAPGRHHGKEAKPLAPKAHGTEPFPWSPDVKAAAMDSTRSSNGTFSTLSSNGSLRRQPGAERLAWALLAFVAAWCVLWFVHALGYWEDDAWIHLEFARSVAAGQGFSFNGHIVYGDTSPLWVWLLVAFHALLPSWMGAGKTLAAFACIFALSGAWRFARELTRELPGEVSRLFAAASLAVLVANPYFAYWAFSGMEALAAAGLVCWGLVVVLPARIGPLRFLLGALIAGVAPLLRPEMSFFTVGLGLVLLLRWWTMRSARSFSAAAAVGLLLLGLALAAGPFLGWAVYAVHTFGTVLPNTNAAKRAAPGASVTKHLFGIYALGFPLAPLGLALLAGWTVRALAAGKQRATAAPGAAATPGSVAALGPLLGWGGWLVLIWTAVNCVFYVLNHTYVQTRYIFVTAPVLTTVLLALALLRWPKIYRPAVAFGMLFGVVLSLLTTWPLIANKVGVDRGYVALAAFFRTLPPDAPVANYSIGEVAFLSQHPLVDTGGITRPGIIPFLWDPTDDRQFAWERSQGAEYIVIDHQPLPGARLLWRHEIPVTGWFLNPHRYRGTDRLEVWTLPPAK